MTKNILGELLTKTIPYFEKNVDRDPNVGRSLNTIFRRFPSLQQSRTRDRVTALKGFLGEPKVDMKSVIEIYDIVSDQFYRDIL